MRKRKRPRCSFYSSEWINHIPPHTQEMTRFIGDGQQHADPGRAGFEYIECGVAA